MSDMQSMEKKVRSAERLLDVIGMIDDSIVAESEGGRSHRGSFAHSPVFRRVASVMAAVLVLAVGIVGSFVIADIARDSNINDGDNATTEDTVRTEGLEGALLAATASNSNLSEIVSVSDIDFFDGVMSLIWQYDGESDYHRMVFDSSASENEIRSQLSKSTVQMDSQSAEAVRYRVWVSYGNGEVVSPYLKDSAGNVGYAELFEYTPEVEPSEGFTEIVNDTVYN